MERTWQVQEAKAAFSALIVAAQTEPQIITRHGAPYAVVLSTASYDELTRQQTRPSFLALLRELPAFDAPERDGPAGRGGSPE